MPNPNPNPKRDPLSATARDVLALFSDALAEVHFPDVDLHSLESAAAALRALQVEAERIETELDAARATVLAHSQALTAQAERGLAYARIFAATDPELAARVAELGCERPTPALPAGSKKRGRPRKVEGDNLFGALQAQGADAPQLAAPIPSGAEYAA